jgi:hypothetical protein
MDRLYYLTEEQFTQLNRLLPVVLALVVDLENHLDEIHSCLLP